MGVKNDCVICRGSGFIKLPVYRPLKAGYAMQKEVTMDVNDIARTYRCPECGADQAAEEKVLVLHSEGEIDAFYGGDPDAMEAVRHTIAHNLARGFLDRGLIEFKERREGSYPERIVVRGTLGVVQSVVVQTMRARVVTQAKEILAGAVDKAAEQIRIWGSLYSGDEGNISKGQAVSAIRTAFSQHMQKVERDG